MDFLAPEEEIVAQLKSQLGSTVHVEAFPNDPETFDFTQPNGAILVRYNASGYTVPQPNRTGAIIQDRSPEWGVVILHRHLKGHTGAYSLLEAVRKALTGFTPASLPESTILYPVRDGFLDRKPGKWVYQVVFAHTLPEVEG